VKFTRRDFLKISSATFAGLSTTGCGVFNKMLDGSDPLDPRFGYGADAKVIPSYCSMCYWKCGLLGHVVDGKLWKLTGNPRDPLSQGRLCGRGTSGVGMLYDPDRLKAPLIRAEVDGKQEYQTASWDQALDRSAKLLNDVIAKHGPESVAFLVHGQSGEWFKPLAKGLGTPNIAKPSAAQCRGSRDIGYALTFGSGLGSPEPLDIENAKTLMLFGSHLGENMHVSQVREFSRFVGKTVEGKARLIVADPRFSVAAGKAWRYLPIKPNTDLALMLAMIHVLLHEGRGAPLYDAEYIEKYATGLPQLIEHVRPYTPEWAYTETGIRPAVTREITRALATEKPNVLIHPGRFNARDGNDTQRARASAILNALLGSYGRKGGFFIADGPTIPQPSHRPYPKNHQPHVSAGKYQVPSGSPVVQDVITATIERKPYPIKAWVVIGTNFFQSVPHHYYMKMALGQLDALIVCDVLPTEPTGYADVVLPECTYMERHDQINSKGFKPSFLSVRQPLVEPMYDSKPGWWIAKKLAEKMGYGDFFPYLNAELLIDTQLRQMGLNPSEVKKQGVMTFDPGPLFIEDGREPKFGAGGKIELYSTILESLGGEPLPYFRAPEPIAPGHLRLLFGRSPIKSFSRSSNNPITQELEHDNELWVHPSAGAQFDVKEGDYVYLENQDGKRSTFRIRVRLTERVRPDCCYMVHGWGSASKKLSRAHGAGINDNELITRIKIDPVMGATGMGLNDVILTKTEERVPREERRDCESLQEEGPIRGLEGEGPKQRINII
jgi:thiosulfate reductase / polysulfide reductase chain A